MKKNKVFTGNFIEILENSELRNVIGGYGAFGGGGDDPLGRVECCTCTYILHWSTGATSTDSGLFCGSYGDSDCENGKENWRGDQIKLYDGALSDVTWGC